MVNSAAYKGKNERYERRTRETCLGLAAKNRNVRHATVMKSLPVKLLDSDIRNMQIARTGCFLTYHESVRALRLGLDSGVDNRLNLLLDAMGLEILLGSLQMQYGNMSRS